MQFQTRGSENRKKSIDIMTRHANLSTLLVAGKRSVFVSQHIDETAEMQGINQ